MPRDGSLSAKCRARQSSGAAAGSAAVGGGSPASRSETACVVTFDSRAERGHGCSHGGADPAVWQLVRAETWRRDGVGDNIALGCYEMLEAMSQRTTLSRNGWIFLPLPFPPSPSSNGL